MVVLQLLFQDRIDDRLNNGISFTAYKRLAGHQEGWLKLFVLWSHRRHASQTLLIDLFALCLLKNLAKQGNQLFTMAKSFFLLLSQCRRLRHRILAYERFCVLLYFFGLRVTKNVLLECSTGHIENVPNDWKHSKNFSFTAIRVTYLRILEFTLLPLRHRLVCRWFRRFSCKSLQFS
jgi:hypothetical protein